MGNLSDLASSRIVGVSVDGETGSQIISFLQMLLISVAKGLKTEC